MEVWYLLGRVFPRIRRHAETQLQEAAKEYRRVVIGTRDRTGVHLVVESAEPGPVLYRALRRWTRNAGFAGSKMVH